MRKVTRRLPSPGVAIGILALVAALAGTSVAATKIGSKEIQKGAVKSKQIAKKAVKSKQIAKKAVKSKQIAKDAVKGRHLADDSVKTSRIKDQAVTGEKLADGAVTGAKVADGAITGPKLADGAVSGAKLADDTGTYARVNAAGNAFSQARGVNGVNRVATGRYCFDLTFAPNNAVATLDQSASGVFGTLLTLVPGHASCPPPFNDATVFAVAGFGAPTNNGFYVQFR